MKDILDDILADLDDLIAHGLSGVEDAVKGVRDRIAALEQLIEDIKKEFASGDSLKERLDSLLRGIRDLVQDLQSIADVAEQASRGNPDLQAPVAKLKEDIRKLEDFVKSQDLSRSGSASSGSIIEPSVLDELKKVLDDILDDLDSLLSHGVAGIEDLVNAVRDQIAALKQLIEDIGRGLAAGNGSTLLQGVEALLPELHDIADKAGQVSGGVSGLRSLVDRLNEDIKELVDLIGGSGSGSGSGVGGIGVGAGGNGGTAPGKVNPKTGKPDQANGASTVTAGALMVLSFCIMLV